MNKIKLRSKQFLSMRCKFAHLNHRMIFSLSKFATKLHNKKKKTKQIITHYLSVGL